MRKTNEIRLFCCVFFYLTSSEKRAYMQERVGIFYRPVLAYFLKKVDFKRINRYNK